MDPMLDDQTLLSHIIDTQPEALSLLYDRYGRLIFSLAVHITGDVATAEEITQDVFLQVWHKAATYHPDLGKVSTWLTSIAHHKAIDRLRHQAVRPEGHSADLAGELDIILSGLPAVEMAVEDNLLSVAIRQALSFLPPDQKQVLLLAYFEGMTQQEISDRLGEPLGTVKTRIRLGMLKLRQLVADAGAP
jgi:RNA polymerase sigma-70 factor (ECF subfamily)